MKLAHRAINIIAFLFLSNFASAGLISSVVGDKDCFGTLDACVEDGSTWLAGGWAAVTAEADDPLFTDRLISTAETQSWNHSFSAAAYSSAFLDIRTVGIADIAGPIDVFVDGVLAGSMPLDGFGHILVETFTFGFNASLLSDGFATVSFTPASSSDAWAIDYSEIRAETASVPEPGSLALLGLGLAAIGLSRKRRDIKVSF